MTIPNQLGIVALYILMNELKWNGTLLAVIVPGLVSAFGVFYMRQFILEAVPDELVEAGRVDGAS
ncbi:MAG TPA: carbohydrate ABC transporter permease, partial [Jiangellales bacterium]|nr:carbohydrate ABC transporter permease [Jiangellales bacterium]